MSGRDSSGPSSTRTSFGSKTHPCTSSMGRTLDDCETSKSTWAFGRRTIGSEVGGAMRWKWRVGFLLIAALQIAFLVWLLSAIAAPPGSLLYTGGTLAPVHMAMRLVRPLWLVLLIVWLGRLMGSAWSFVRFLPPTAALGLGATLSTIVSAVGAPLGFRTLKFVVRQRLWIRH